MGRTKPKRIEWQGHLYDIHRDGSILWVGPSSQPNKKRPHKRVKKRWMIQAIMEKAANEAIGDEQKAMAIIATAAARANVHP